MAGRFRRISAKGRTIACRSRRLRGTARAFYCREQRGFSWRSWPAPMRDPRSPEVAAFAVAHRGSRRVFPVPAMGSRPSARRGRGGRARRRAVARALSRPRGRRRPERRRSLGRPGAGGAACRDRRAARRAEPRRAELGPGAGQSAGAAPPALRAVYRLPARQHAPCRGFADRPRHVAEPALLDPERHGGDPRLLCPLSVRRAAAARGARKPSPVLRCRRRGSRHRAAGLSRDDAGGECVVLSHHDVRAPRRTAALSARKTTRRSPRLRPRPTISPPSKGFWLGRDIAWRRQLGLYPDANAAVAGRRRARARPPAAARLRWSPRDCWRARIAASSCPRRASRSMPRRWATRSSAISPARMPG